MNIEGTYKISIEQSARKRVDGLLATTKRLLGHVGARDIPDPPGKEEQIQKVIALFQQDEEAVRSISLEICSDRIIARNAEAEDVYVIKERRDSGDGRVLLSLESEEMGSVQWDATFCDSRYFMFESDDEMSEYVWERV
jgi:hypothetical protein